MRLHRLFRLALKAAIIFAMFIAAGYWYYYFQEKPRPDLMLKPLPEVGKQTRLLVIAPHCDDEALGCAGLIHQVLQDGGQAMVVVMTNGDGFTFATEEQFHRFYLTSADYINSGYVRQRESLAAMRLLGVTEDSLHFLGFPDRGLEALWNNYWETSKPFRSRYTESDHSPYFNSYQKNAPYAGQAVLADLEDLITRFRPTLIVLPHPQDEHRDHAATYAFVVTAVAELTYRGMAPPTLYSYLVHRGDFPIPHGYKPDAPLLPPRPLVQINFPGWLVRSLDPETQRLKEQTIREYHSQIRIPVMAGLLQSFMRPNELFEEVRLPVVEKVPPAPGLGNPAAWPEQPPFMVNPVGLNPLSSLEPNARITAAFAYIQGNSLWLRFRSPDFTGSSHQYRISVMAFYFSKTGLYRQKRDFTVENDAGAPNHLYKDKENLILEIPFEQQQMPELCFFHVTTIDGFGVAIDRTAWQPALPKRP